MKSLLSACALIALLCAPAFADDYAQQTTYTIDVGNGDVILIVGNNNAIYVPAPQSDECEPVKATMLGDGSTVVVMPRTELSIAGALVRWERIVLVIGPDGYCRVVAAQ